MKKTIVLVAAILIILLAVTITGGCQEKAKPVHLAMGYIPNVQFAPWYVAQEKGYFAEAGLEVEMDYAQVNDLMRLLAAGKIDFAIAGGDEIIVARGQGIPVTYIMALYSRFPAVVVSLADEGITAPADLEGKSIGLPGFYGTNYIAIKAILAAAGLSESQVTLRPIGYTQVPTLTQGKVDAVVGFANNEPVQLHQLGLDVNIIESAQYFDLVGHGVVAGETVLAKDPDKARAFVEATLRGMRYTLDHPEEAFEICLKYVPEAGGANREAQYEVMLESMRLWESERTKENGLGYSDPAAWEKSQEMLVKWDIIPKAAPVSKLVNNDFLN